MSQPCVQILGIAPYEGMRTVMEKAAELYPSVQLDVFTGDLEEGVSIVKNAPANTYDCIISRGGTAQLIRQVTNIPVVEITLSVYDVLRAINLATNYCDFYAVVGFPGITEVAHTLCDLMRYDIDILTVHSAEEANITLQHLQQSGCRTVVCDTVTHTIAQDMGLDAFLITSGIESLQAAIIQAINMSNSFRTLRQENIFLKCVAERDSGRTVVLDEEGQIIYCSPGEPPLDFVSILREKIPEIPPSAVLKFYHNDRSLLYTVTAQTIFVSRVKGYLFYCIPAQIPLKSGRPGLRSFNKSESEYLFQDSFYNLNGSFGELEPTISSITGTYQPVMILGESGTCKESVARFLYLRGPLSNKPFVSVDCSLINTKSWDFLLNHYNSPLNDTGNTIYFEHLEALSDTRRAELLSSVADSGISRHRRLIFSSSYYDGIPLNENAKSTTSTLGCITLFLPTLRSRSDEIQSLALLYLCSLNIKSGKQISGFEPRAISQLRNYDWPNNYRQFLHVLNELSALTISSYIRSSTVTDILSKESILSKNSVPQASSVNTDLTLDQITCNIVRQTVAAHNGNQSAAARQLGISRTTLWRYINRTSLQNEQGT